MKCYRPQIVETDTEGLDYIPLVEMVEDDRGEWVRRADAMNLPNRVAELAFQILNREGPIQQVWDDANNPAMGMEHFLPYFEDVGGLEAALARESQL